MPVSQKQLLQQLEIHPHSYGFPADVFSYALVLLECATGQVTPKALVLMGGRAWDCLCCQGSAILAAAGPTVCLIGCMPYTCHEGRQASMLHGALAPRPQGQCRHLSHCELPN